MTRTEIIDEIVKNNTLTIGYSGFDKSLNWNANDLNKLENVDNPDLAGVTFQYVFYIHLFDSDYKSNLESKVSNNQISTPNSLTHQITNTIVYNTQNLPVYQFKKINDEEWKITYKINYRSSFYTSNSCKEDPSNCEEIFSSHAVKSNNKVEQSHHVSHFDLYHLLQTVGKYPPSDKILNEYKKITVQTSNQDNAFRLFHDYCYFMKKRLGLDQSHVNNSNVTKFNNFCGFDFDGGNPDILISSRNYDGETINVNGINREIQPSEFYLNFKKYENYQNVSEFSTKPLQSYPEAKFQYLNYCRGSNFNNPECKKFYQAMYKKASEDGGNLDEDVQNHILLMCQTKEKYVPDDIYYYNKIFGEFYGNDIGSPLDLTKEECQVECDKLSSCQGFVMDLPTVELFADVNFRQKLGILSEGKYDLEQMEENGIPNDSVLALKIPEGFVAVCYEHNFEGDSIILSGNVILADYNFHNKISSIEITQFDCEAYKQNNPDLLSIYGSGCQVLQNHFKEYGMKEGRDASGFFKGKGCWLKRKMTEHTKNNSKVAFKKQDTDDVCSCFYNEEYYNDYLKKNNFPVEASREKPECWFPKCFGGESAMKAEPNKQCSDLIICNSEVQNFLQAGRDLKNVTINVEQFSQCNKTGEQENNDDPNNNDPNQNRDIQINEGLSMTAKLILGISIGLGVIVIIAVIVLVVVIKNVKKVKSQSLKLQRSQSQSLKLQRSQSQRSQSQNSK